MQLPITSVLAGLLTLLFMTLNVQLAMRQIQLGGDVFKNLTSGGDDEVLLRRRIAFWSAGMHIPMSLILFGLMEIGRASQLQLIVLATILIVCRILHVLGCYYQTLPKIRSFSYLIQFAYYIVCGFWLMSGAYFMLSVR